MGKSNYKQNILKYVNQIQQDENIKIIPENIYTEAKTNYENYKLKKLYINYGIAHGLGVSAMMVGSTIGLFTGPLGFAIGSGIGGLIWSLSSAASTVMDRCVISNNLLPDNEIKIYEKYKNFSFEKNKEFSKYFPQNFNSEYNDIIKIKIDATDSQILFNKNIVYSGIIEGLFCRFEMIKLTSCRLIPIEDLSNAINI